MPRRLFRLLAGTVVASLAVLATPLTIEAAQATTLTGALTANDAFQVYLSTSPSTLGTLLTSGANWGQAYTFSNAALTTGETYYLNIETANLGGAAGFIGSFSLSGTDFHFANNSQQLDTGVRYWTGGFNAATSNLPRTWTRPTGRVVSVGRNGVAPWYSVSGVPSTADWIWPSDRRSSPRTRTRPRGTTRSQCTYCVVDFQTEIIPVAGLSVASQSTVPEPTSIAVFAVALAGLAAARRRSRVPSG